MPVPENSFRFVFLFFFQSSCSPFGVYIDAFRKRLFKNECIDLRTYMCVNSCTNRRVLSIGAGAAATHLHEHASIKTVPQ